MDAASLHEEPTFEEIPWWVGAAKVGERAGFAIGIVMYALPFIYQPMGDGAHAFTSPYRYGVEIFILSVLAVGLGSFGLLLFGSFGVPLLASIAGLFLQKAPTRVGAIARFLCAVGGLGGLTLAFLWQRSVNWQLGFYGAAAGLGVAVVAAGLRSVAAFRYPADESV